MLEGVLPVLKPIDYTSHDVVAKARRILHLKRIGHTGTLDPKVTGVLPLCLGKATRIVEYIQDLPKQYEAELTIGYRTDTEDSSGNVEEQVESVQLEEEQIRAAIRSFVGDIQQVPPMYSAVKVDGKRLYELARQGVEVERKPRKVTIYSIDLLNMDLQKKHPTVRFCVTCSKGTYIRTLCADIGKALGYPATMSSLIRSSTGSIALEQCLTLEQIEQLQEQRQLQKYVIPTDQAVRHFPALTVRSAYSKTAIQGQKLPFSALTSTPESGAGLFRIYEESGAFIGIYSALSEECIMKPEKLFVP